MVKSSRGGQTTFTLDDRVESIKKTKGKKPIFEIFKLALDFKYGNRNKCGFITLQENYS